MVETTNSFRHCSACQDACYCSKECQQRDWKSGEHCEACKRLRQNRASKLLTPYTYIYLNQANIVFQMGYPLRLPPRDISFFIHLSVNDLLKNCEQIIRMRDQQLQVQPSTRHAFVILINRFVSPPKISITTAEGYKQWCKNPMKTPILDPPPKNAPPIRAKNTLVYQLWWCPVEHMGIQWLSGMKRQVKYSDGKLQWILAKNLDPGKRCMHISYRRVSHTPRIPFLHQTLTAKLLINTLYSII